MFLIDSHCHLDRLNYKNIHKNIDDVIKKAFKHNVKFMLTISTSISNFKKTFKMLKNKFINVRISCGIHPLYISKNSNIEKMLTLSKNEYVIGIGETGLDYTNINHNKKKQIKFFKYQIDVAKKIKKPIIVHSRNSKNDTINVLQREKSEICGGVLHCFTEDIDMARKLLNIGFYISISGIITFKNTYALNELVKYLPIDRILIESDSPYLSPEPYRKKENQPANVSLIANHLSKIKKINLFDLSYILKNNFINLFNCNFLKKYK
ncbi:YchF/TatD family DNA exonuclease [Buchnera aphidicola (Taiwanaphis decaspermi)]|uniref:TatD family hydrolase n=1 Tax=Buchnera aphidicola TaxID=9 RepID=UPI0031B89ADA